MVHQEQESPSPPLPSLLYNQQRQMGSNVDTYVSPESKILELSDLLVIPKQYAFEPNDVKAILDSFLSINNHIVILVGYTSSHSDILIACNVWLRKSFEKRRLVVISSSMTSRGKTNPRG